MLNKIASVDEKLARVELAALFRLAAYNDWHEATANHFSYAISADGKEFLMNPRWVHFSSITASSLLKLHVDDEDAMNRPNAPDKTAWALHGRLHANLPQARVIIHLHPTYATVLASLKDPTVLPIDQNTARFFNRVAYDLGYGGMANSKAEGDRISSLLGNKSVMMMGNHGVLVCGNTAAEVYDTMYYLERACRNLVLAYQTQQPLHILRDDVAEKTAQEWEDYSDAWQPHFDEMRKLLDKTDGSYKS